MFKFYEKYPDLFVPVISVHPYRKDAVQELEKWAKKVLNGLNGCQTPKGLTLQIPVFMSIIRIKPVAIFFAH